MYILTETASTAGHVDGMLNESFETYEEACERLRQLYHKTAVESDPDCIIDAYFSESDAYIIYTDYYRVDWEVADEADIAEEMESIQF